jgi:hypothetical protein
VSLEQTSFPPHPPPFTAAFYARAARAHNLRYHARPGPRHRSNTTPSISRLLASRPPARATIKGPSSQLRVVDLQEGKKEKGEGEEAAMYMNP